MNKTEIKLKCLELAINTPSTYGGGDNVPLAEHYYEFVKPKSWLSQLFNSKSFFSKNTSDSVHVDTSREFSGFF